MAHPIAFPGLALSQVARPGATVNADHRNVVIFVFYSRHVNVKGQSYALYGACMLLIIALLELLGKIA